MCKEGRRKKQRNLTKQFNKTRTKQEPKKQNKPIKKSISDKTDHDVALRWTRTRYHVIVVSHGIRRSCLFVHFNQFCLFAGTNVLPCLPQQFAEYKKNTRRSAVEYNEEQNIDRSVIIHSMLKCQLVYICHKVYIDLPISKKQSTKINKVKNR